MILSLFIPLGILSNCGLLNCSWGTVLSNKLVIGRRQPITNARESIRGGSPQTSIRLRFSRERAERTAFVEVIAIAVAEDVEAQTV